MKDQKPGFIRYLKLQIAFFFFLTIIFSCKRNIAPALGKIDIFSEPDSEITNLSGLASDVVYIPLETSENSIIPHIIDLKCNSGSFFINTTLSELLVFDGAGRFLVRLSQQGRGPEEYIGIKDYDISENNDSLLILSTDKVILYLLTDSGYVFSKSVRMPVDGPGQIDLLSDKEGILLTYTGQDWDKPFRNLVIDFDGDTVNSRVNNYMYSKQGGPIAVIRAENNRFNFENRPHFKEIYNDTIYSIDKNNCFIPYLILNTERKALKTSVRAKNKELDISKFVVFWYIYETHRYFLYEYSYEGSHHSVILDKKQGIKHELNSSGSLADDIIGGVDFRPRFSCDDFLISWIDVLKLKDHISSDKFINSKPLYPEKKKELEKLANNLLDTDNPVLVMVRLKE